jgi:hypothetical protein
MKKVNFSDKISDMLSVSIVNMLFIAVTIVRPKHSESNITTMKI